MAASGDLTQPASPVSIEQAAARGKAVREAVPRSSHGEYAPAPDRVDPLVQLRGEDEGRLLDLVPIRYGRMLSSSFAFFRGSAVLMANDLGDRPHSGLIAQLCGDAHLSNFGAFASPDRKLVFDVDDLDETLPGPFEWDLKRLVASVAIAGRSLDHTEDQRRAATEAATAAYRIRMRELSEMGNLELWYSRTDLENVLEQLDGDSDVDAAAAARVRKNAAKAYTKDAMHDLAKLTELVDGSRRIKSQPPLIVPIEELLPGVEAAEIHTRLSELIDSYSATLPNDRRHLISRYRLVHFARKVVGVGSVGTRCWIVLLLGRDDADPLFLQIKEAGPSVLEPVLGASEYSSPGERVIAGQRLMQAAPDILIGWQNTVGIDGVERSFYVRQLKNWKASAKIQSMTPPLLKLYGELCARVLARAHARSGDRVAISAYLGKSDVFDRALAEFAEQYADQNEADYQRLLGAERDGELEVRRDT